MTDSERKKSPDFFEDREPDPVTAAMHYVESIRSIPKKKAGFYLSEELIGRFNRQFHQMKLAGTPIENKSALLEIALEFALDDLAKGKKSLLLQAMNQRTHNSNMKGTT